MTDRERVITGLEIILNGCDEIQCEDCCFHIKEPTKPRRCGIDEEQIQEEALALLKEQEDEKPVLDEFGRCFLNALKRQLDMKLQMIELLITPEFAEKVVELIEEMYVNDTVAKNATTTMTL